MVSVEPNRFCSQGSCKPRCRMAAITGANISQQVMRILRNGACERLATSYANTSQ